MISRLAADVVVLLHLAFIVFVTAGAFVVLRWPRIAWLHIPCVLWGIWIEVTGRVCPLTPLENHLRLAAGGDGYGGGFIEHYVLPLVYPAQMTRGTQIALGVGVAALNLCLYGLVVLRRSPSRKARDR